MTDGPGCSGSEWAPGPRDASSEEVHLVDNTDYYGPSNATPVRGRVDKRIFTTDRFKRTVYQSRVPYLHRVCMWAGLGKGPHTRKTAVPAYSSDTASLPSARFTAPTPPPNLCTLPGEHSPPLPATSQCLPPHHACKPCISSVKSCSFSCPTT
jgi:hypothetical protein